MHFHNNSERFRNKFSIQSKIYTLKKPPYPEIFFRYLIGECRYLKLAWNAGNGDGYVTQKLSKHFDKVYTNEASTDQLLKKPSNKMIRHDVSSEKAHALKNNSVDLITVEHTLHWFDVKTFFAEAERVLKRYGLIACWCYKLFRVNQKVDLEIDRLYSDVLGNFWDPEIRLVETSYRTLSFPFRELRTKNFNLKTSWDFQYMISYLRTWPSVYYYTKGKGSDPIEENLERLKKAWGEPEDIKNVTWPLFIRAGHAR